MTPAEEGEARMVSGLLNGESITTAGPAGLLVALGADPDAPPAPRPSSRSAPRLTHDQWDSISLAGGMIRVRYCDGMDIEVELDADRGYEGPMRLSERTREWLLRVLPTGQILRLDGHVVRVRARDDDQVASLVALFARISKVVVVR